ncbi:hypothetical protein KRX57_06145 [Weeksellaceae bacterium TAE3-ERU29]|nr:hypothetical protein [Weeksellaceae bacterium TAE3-ERU29]
MNKKTIQTEQDKVFEEIKYSTFEKCWNYLKFRPILFVVILLLILTLIYFLGVKIGQLLFHIIN